MTPVQVESPSCVSGSRSCYRQWDQNICTKDATFSASSHATLTS